jgi:hypothetical protein
VRRLKDKIIHKYEELPNGASVRTTTPDPDAPHAIHNFFKYQIQEHRTGDRS